MVTESQARLDEYIEASKLLQKTIIKEIQKEKDKEIEHLKKEKEWLINKIIDAYGCKYKDKTREEIKEMLDMQQVLREGR